MIERVDSYQWDARGRLGVVATTSEAGNTCHETRGYSPDGDLDRVGIALNGVTVADLDLEWDPTGPLAQIAMGRNTLTAEPGLRPEEPDFDRDLPDPTPPDPEPGCQTYQEHRIEDYLRDRLDPPCKFERVMLYTPKRLTGSEAGEPLRVNARRSPFLDGLDRRSGMRRAFGRRRSRFDSAPINCRSTC